MTRYLGVDLHKKSFTVSFFNAESGKHKLRTYRLKDLDLFYKDLSKGDVVGVEALANTRYFVDKIKDYVCEVKIVDPYQQFVISQTLLTYYIRHYHFQLR